MAAIAMPIATPIARPLFTLKCYKDFAPQLFSMSYPHKSAIRKTTFTMIFCIFTLIFGMPIAYAQSIPITLSGTMEGVKFDGQWTFTSEWKQSSVDEIKTDSGNIYLRSAHQGNFIYILLDVVPDNTIDDNEDWAVVCFDAKNEKNIKPDENDFCFMIKLGSNKAVTLQGNDSGELVVVKNHADLIGVGGVSSVNDRYSQKPHPAFEFRIPIELLERTNQYGFYVGVFDFTKSATYTWPPEIDLDPNSDIPSPDQWGLIYSPDKSLPEYDLPILVLLLGTFSIILFSWKNKKLNLSYLNR